MLSEMSQPSLSIVFQSGRLIVGSAISLFMAIHRCYQVLSVALFAHSYSGPAAQGEENAHQIGPANAFKMKIKVSPSLCIIKRERTLCVWGVTRPPAPATNYASNEEKRVDSVKKWWRYSSPAGKIGLLLHEISFSRNVTELLAAELFHMKHTYTHRHLSYLFIARNTMWCCWSATDK